MYKKIEEDFRTFRETSKITLLKKYSYILLSEYILYYLRGKSKYLKKCWWGYG